ncbi:LacI family DNA-binding transcriptional regulator [Rhodovibrio salinarum]|uniref:HTH lacI-type domain-containing protein n=1 Tax=Rhodovibrio salinarum TaxID=1087 RepID=A0A934QG40_9PROT|nr:LacI family DNA-binding transcriptional regulator [Rhodovibrio salinarum]MBK1696144.1 hypothetical protein [Rhodovibrio salinarum]
MSEKRRTSRGSSSRSDRVPSASVRLTARDVAASLGVSISTVSRAFTENAVISEETRRMVLEEASRMGYTPDVLARSMITRRTRIAGIAVADITNPFYPEVLARLTRRLHEAGMQSMVFFADPGRNVDDAIPTLLQYKPDVALILAATLSSETTAACKRAGTPVLLFNRNVQDAQVESVTCDNLDAGRMVAEVLLGAGHRRLAFIQGLSDTSTNRDRLEGFQQGARAAGAAEPTVEAAGGFTYEGGYAALKRLMDGLNPPDAVFCANDIVALGALDAARRELGLQVPQDLSVIGFDDISMAAWPSYDLTTVRQPVNAMIQLTVEKIQALLSKDDQVPEQVFLPGRLIRRSSARLEER